MEALYDLDLAPNSHHPQRYYRVLDAESVARTTMVRKAETHA